MNNRVLLIGLSITVLVEWLFISAFSYAAFAGAIGGAIIAAGVTLSITTWQREIESQKRIKNIKLALFAEINSLEERWNFSVGGRLQPLNDGEVPPRAFVYIQEDYFVVYNSNANNVGMLNPVLSGAVVSFYQNAKAFVDTVRTWGKILEVLNEKLKEEKRNILNIEEEKWLIDYYNVMLREQNEVFKQGNMLKEYLVK